MQNDWADEKAQELFSGDGNDVDYDYYGSAVAQALRDAYDAGFGACVGALNLGCEGREYYEKEWVSKGYPKLPAT